MDTFRAISDPKRRDIIALLANQKSATISSISERFPDTRQAITKHINILNSAGLIEIKKSGRNRYCELNLEYLSEVKEWVDFYSNLWDEKLNSLDAYLRNNSSTNT